MTDRRPVVGILWNPDYPPSRNAATNLREVTQGIDYPCVDISLEALLDGSARADLAFNVYYGEFGDGGLATRLLEANGIRAISNGAMCEAMMLNKVIAKRVFAKLGHATPSHWHQKASESPTQVVESVLSTLHLPIIAKPVNGSASENVVLLEDAKSLREYATAFVGLIASGAVFFEEFIEGDELIAGCVGLFPGPLPVAQVRLDSVRFQSREAKFRGGLKRDLIPAPISVDLSNRVQSVAVNLSRAFNAHCFSRIDCIYVAPADKLYVLEINANPGLLQSSLLPRMLHAAGLSMEWLVGGLIKEAVEKVKT